jgi:hypothetical protein
MKRTMLFVIFLMSLASLFSQEIEYDAKFNLTICTVTRNAPGELFIKNGDGNTFSGVLSIDNDVREVFGWYVDKISEGGIHRYNTKSIIFYVKLNADFQHQQLFRGILNYDETYLSGTYFYWGVEFIFFGDKVQ